MEERPTAEAVVEIVLLAVDFVPELQLAVESGQLAGCCDSWSWLTCEEWFVRPVAELLPIRTLAAALALAADTAVVVAPAVAADPGH